MQQAQTPHKTKMKAWGTYSLLNTTNFNILSLLSIFLL